MLTVALPIFRMKQIAWLAFEGLAMQQGAPAWELVVCEEAHNNECAEELITEYKDRLFEAGCIKITYIKPEMWISLATKWQLIGQHSGNSIGFVLQAADCYPHANRLAQTYKALKEGAEWYHESNGYFYDLSCRRLIEYDHSTMDMMQGWRTGLNMAFSTEYARTIPVTEKIRGIDQFLFGHCVEQGLKTVVMQRPTAIGVDTNSANVLSLGRINNFFRPRPPFIACDRNLGNLNLPEDVIQRLKRMKVEPIKDEVMKEYLFLRNRNIYKKGQKVNLPDVVAELWLKENVIEPVNCEHDTIVKVLTPEKETKVLEPIKVNKDVSKAGNKRKPRRN